MWYIDINISFCFHFVPGASDSFCSQYICVVLCSNILESETLFTEMCVSNWEKLWTHTLASGLVSYSCLNLQQENLFGNFWWIKTDARPVNTARSACSGTVEPGTCAECRFCSSRAFWVGEGEKKGSQATEGKWERAREQSLCGVSDELYSHTVWNLLKKTLSTCRLLISLILPASLAFTLSLTLFTHAENSFKHHQLLVQRTAARSSFRKT